MLGHDLCRLRAHLPRKPLVEPRLCGDASLFSRCSHTAKAVRLLWGQWGTRVRIGPEVQSPPFYETHTYQNEQIQWADWSCHHGHQKRQTLKPRVTWELTFWLLLHQNVQFSASCAFYRPSTQALLPRLPHPTSSSSLQEFSKLTTTSKVPVLQVNMPVWRGS